MSGVGPTLGRQRGCMLLAVIFALHARAIAAPLVSSQVAATAGRACDVHLHAAPGATALPLVAMAGGTGRYTLSAHASLFSRLVDEGRLAVVAFDKPGIHAAPESEAGFTVDEPAYRAYTQADLATCVVGAVAWARTQAVVDSSAPLVLYGHSEGALVMLDVLARLSTTDDSPVGAALLSGTPTEATAASLQRQVGSSWRSYRRAIEEGDDDFLVEEVGVSSASLRDMFAAPGFNGHLSSLAALRVSTPISMFHGGNDTAADAAHAEDTFVARWRRVHPADRRPLDLSMRVYPACGHLNCPQATRDLLLVALATAAGRAGAPAPARGSSATVVDLPVAEPILSAAPGRYAVLGLLPFGSVVARGDQLVLMNRALPAVTLLHQGDGQFVRDDDPLTEVNFTPSPRRLTIRKSGITLPLRRMGPPRARHARRVEGAPMPGPPWPQAAPTPAPAQPLAPAAPTPPPPGP